MAKFFSFKKVEVTGSTKEEALAKAPYFIQGDATQAYKNWVAAQDTAITDDMVKEFMLSYLEAKSKNAPGVGYYITKESAVADTRERPWSFTNVKNTKGKRKFVTTYQLVDDNNQIYGQVTGSKDTAMDLAKEIISNGYHGELKCIYTQQVVEGEPLAFTVKYTPSKGTHPGCWVCFGVENC